MRYITAPLLCLAVCFLSFRVDKISRKTVKTGISSQFNNTLKNGKMTKKNRKIIEDFADIFYRQKDVEKAFIKYVAEDYIQHNPNILDGRKTAITALKPKFSNPEAIFDIKRIIVDGNLAVIHVHGRMNRTQLGGAVADIYRLENGKIVEHWDVLQPIPEKAISLHPMF